MSRRCGHWGADALCVVPTRRRLHSAGCVRPATRAGDGAAPRSRPWGEERIAAELLLKLGISVSSRTVSRYMYRPPPGHRPRSQVWSTFVRNHARDVLACDFFLTVTATFR